MPKDDDRPTHIDPAVQALINDSWIGEWERPVTAKDLKNAVRLVREADAKARKD